MNNFGYYLRNIWNILKVIYIVVTFYVNKNRYQMITKTQY